MQIFTAEFFGTALLIIFGDGVVANTILDKSFMKGGGSIQITIAWGLAVMIPAFIFGAISGAHFNPALTLALACDGSVQWANVPQYISGQFLGAFAGAIVVYILFKNHLDQTQDSETKFAVFATRPSIPNKPLNFLGEFIQTFILVFCLKGILNVPEMTSELSYIYVFAIITAIGMSFGGLTGYAINPARDFAPRLAHALLPIKGKGSSHWDYAFIPICAPILGAISAIFLFNFLDFKPI